MVGARLILAECLIGQGRFEECGAELDIVLEARLNYPALRRLPRIHAFVAAPRYGKQGQALGGRIRRVVDQSLPKS